MPDTKHHINKNEITQQLYENQIIFDISLDIMTELIESRDEESVNHIARIKIYMERLARRLAQNAKYTLMMDEAYIERVIKACPFHDIGKIGISDQILLKPGLLTDEEFTRMKEHVLIGNRAIQRALKRFISQQSLDSTVDSQTMVFFTETMNIVRSHHEQYDGSGYPDGLIGEAIPLSARMMALIDVFDALTQHRIYKPAWSIDKAIEYIEIQSGYQFDPDCVDAMVAELDYFKEMLTQLTDK